MIFCITIQKVFVEDKILYFWSLYGNLDLEGVNLDLEGVNLEGG